MRPPRPMLAPSLPLPARRPKVDPTESRSAFTCPQFPASFRAQAASVSAAKCHRPPTAELTCTCPPHADGPREARKVRQVADDPIDTSRRSGGVEELGADALEVKVAKAGIAFGLPAMRSRTVELRAASNSRPARARTRGTASLGKSSSRTIRSLGGSAVGPLASTNAIFPAHRMASRSPPADVPSACEMSRSPTSMFRMRRTLSIATRGHCSISSAKCPSSAVGSCSAALGPAVVAMQTKATAKPAAKR